MKCPILCGQCCEYWRDVVEAEGSICPHEGLRGCKLPRKDRPQGCLDYMCEIAQAVLDGLITKEKGLEWKMECYQFLPKEYRCPTSNPPT